MEVKDGGKDKFAKVAAVLEHTLASSPFMVGDSLTLAGTRWRLV
jgi:glutathione S-transferase